MELIVGVNSYITLEEANALVDSMYKVGSAEYEYWHGQDDNSKIIDILNMTDELETNQLFWKGVKADIHQDMMFPRVLCCGITLEFNDRMKKGLIVSLMHNNVASTDETAAMVSKGVKDYKIKDASIEFFESASNNVKNGEIEGTSINKNIFLKYFIEYTDLVSI